jgi:hypothetical protein
MVRFLDRLAVIGMGVVAVVIAVSSIVLKRDDPSTEETSWSPHQRGLVATGPVRAKPAETTMPPSDPVQGEQEKPLVQKQATGSEDQTTSSSGPDASPQTTASSRPEDNRHRAAATTSRKYATNEHALKVVPRARRTERSETGANERHTQQVETSRRQDDGPRPLAPVVAADTPARTPESPTLTTDSQGAERAPADTTRSASPAPEPAPAPRSESTLSSQTTTDASHFAAASSGPKTRKQVEDELRKARQDGSLPRFGNPDPAGPGGTLNAEQDQ